jgi:antitoxin (DNA-binding transcriptional repressor) of toxin-antitoxin stability system
MGNQVVITEAEAERSFPELLRAVKAGQRVTITDGDKPVAELGPSPAEDDAEGRTAWAELQAHLRTVEPRIAGPWSREEIWDEISR